MTKKDILDIEKHTLSGWSPVHLAAKTGSLDALKALVNAGADINSTDMSYGRTVLHISVEYYHRHIVEYLLEKVSSLKFLK